VTLDVGFVFLELVSKSINQKSVIGAAIRIAASRSNGYHASSTITFIVGSPTFPAPTTPFGLKSKPQPSPCI
jgi:hypothetical protein